MEDVRDQAPVPSDAAWYEADVPKPLDQVTISELEQLCEAVFEQRKVVEEKKDLLSLEQEKLNRFEMQVQAFLKGTNRENYRSKLGTLTLIKKQSWALPKSDEDRRKFFDYLRDEGTFESMITVNSNTFNSYLKEKFLTAENEGRSSVFCIPGVGSPSVFESLRVVKGK